MPKRLDLKKIVILGSGPIVIGQACEFDYSGTQACRVLKREGYEVVLINSNPATIMTDPEVASKVYIEPLQINFVEKILEKEKPDALIPTLGGQTALNLALELHHAGILKRLGVQLLGAIPEVIERAENREKFREILDKVGAAYPKSVLVKSFEQGVATATEMGFPLILRPNFTLGGGGGGVAYSLEEYQIKLATALHESPTSEVLVEDSIIGWKEFELEVMRDQAGTFVVVCSIENMDPCGVHTGDSITVAPQQTLTDKEYQAMRDEAAKIIEAVGVETGGANIQFAVHPSTRQRMVIEMNPRVSRSSALASKATGFPIAKLAALLAVGYELHEVRNEITGTTPSCYEPALDYVVTKIPRFAFEKFPGAKDTLSTQMRSVGEVMGIGRTFKESLQKALISLEKDPRGFKPVEMSEKLLAEPNSERIHYIFEALRLGRSVNEVARLTQIDPWFIEQINMIVVFAQQLKLESLDYSSLLEAKRLGFSDAAIGYYCASNENEIRKLRWSLDLRPCYFRVDTCAGEFASETPYFYSTYWSGPSPRLSHEKIVVLLGSGPNRIGQGVEFDYSCVRSVREFQRQGWNVAIINSNPETVSTDYDTANLLFFEPLSIEHVSEVLAFLRPEGFVAQLGGQTPIYLAPHLVGQGFKLFGSSLETMELAEDRGRFLKVCERLKVEVPKSGMVASVEEALQVAESIGYPLMCRPSYVLGGRRMEIIENQEELISYFSRFGQFFSSDKLCLIDQFLERALEIDVDLVRGRDWSVIGGVLEHIEAAGIHSGDSQGVVPPQRLKESICDRIEEVAHQLAQELNIIGFLNIQMAVKDDQIFVLEANPRSSRSVPFISKATGVPIVDLGVKALLGIEKAAFNPSAFNWRAISGICVKGVVFPFKKFPDADSILGPEMKSTGESMGRGREYSEALLKAILSSGVRLPLSGEVFCSLRDKDKEELLPVARKLIAMGYTLSGTGGTAAFFQRHGLNIESIRKVSEGRPHCVDRIRSGQISLVLNTTSGRKSIEESASIRRSCVDYSIPCITESDQAHALLVALEKYRGADFDVSSL